MGGLIPDCLPTNEKNTFRFWYRYAIEVLLYSNISKTCKISIFEKLRLTSECS